ncbi:MAG TPA: hypothetical protein PKJ28_04210 [Bacteroidales bacterium]|nr:hypothetical protein [Bacteroidales bacterium]
MKKTANFFLVLLIILTTGFSASAGKKEIRFSTSEPDAKIYVDGKLMGAGQLIITAPAYSCIVVKVEKLGYLTGNIEFCNKPDYTPPPKSFYYQMEKDDAYDASEATDIANVDIEIKTHKSELDAWKLLSQIITSYFDVIEVTDRETGYMRTSWVVQSFKQTTVRTRIIVKLGESDPLTYKIKLVSEVANGGQVSVKSDELFKEWDRILRKYREVIHEVQTRVGN